MLVALGFPPVLCDKIVAFRNGRDELEGTEDDQSFEDLSSVVQLLANRSYLDNNAKAALGNVIQSGMLTVKSQNFTAQVLARLKYKSQFFRITAVFNEKGVIKRWEETFGVS